MSLRIKLMLALLLTGLAAVAMVGVLTYTSVNSKFDTIRRKQAAEHFHSFMTAYLEKYGDWQTAVRTESFDRFVQRTEPRTRDGERASDMMERMPPSIDQQSRPRPFDPERDGEPPGQAGAPLERAVAAPAERLGNAAGDRPLPPRRQDGEPGAPARGRPAPPDGLRPPAEGERPPQDDRRPPPDDRGASQDDRRPPRDGARPPQDGRGAPPDDRRPPRDDARPPQDGRGGPPDDRRPPRDGARPPQDGRGASPDDRRPPPDGARPPQDGRGGAPDDRRPPRDGARPPQDSRGASPDDRRPPPDGERPPQDGRRAAPDGNRPPPPDGRPPRDGDRPPPNGRQPAREGERPLTQRDASTLPANFHRAVAGGYGVPAGRSADGPPPDDDEQPGPPGPPGPRRRDGPPPFRFVLTDQDYKVLLGAGQYVAGSLLPPDARALARPIIVKDKPVAYVSTEGVVTPSKKELEFLAAMRSSLLAGVASAAALALGLGLLLSRSLSSRLSHLQRAVRAMQGGSLRQQVPVQGKDEVAVLAGAFNEMSEQLARSHEELKASHQTILEQAEQLRELSVRDALTSLYNRRHFDEQATSLFEQAVRYQRPLSLVICDIDFFKRINDNFSHATGDVVLRHVGAILRKHMRLSDLVARYGGEEFVFALPETELPQAAALCDKVRTLIEQHPWHEVHPELKVTISMGVFADLAAGSAETMLQKADALLYQAKENGRNRVCYA